MSAARTEFFRLGRLAVPAIITQMGMMAMGMVDVMMVGHVSVEALGMVTLGRIWVFGTLIAAIGVLAGMDPLIAQAYGRRDPEAMALTFQRGLVMAVLLSVPVGISWLFTGTVLGFLDQEPDLLPLAHEYVVVQIPSIPFFLMYSAMRHYLQGQTIMKPAMWVVMVANLVNVVLNYGLIYGNLGMPEMGVVGAGLATMLVRVFMCLGLAFVIWRQALYRDAWTPWSRRMFEWSGLRRILHYGLPVGFQNGSEIWAFETAALMSGKLGTLPLGAHAVTLQMAALSFMMPMGLSVAAATRVGNLIGARRPIRAQVSAWVALGTAASLMVVSAIVFVVFRHQIPLLYSSDAALVALAATVLPIAGAFQIFDGTQVVATGILRGMGHTRIAAVANVIGYYLLGLPVAALLAFGRGWGIHGIWWGMCVGLATVAVLLTFWIWRYGPARVDARVISDDDAV